MWDIVKKVKDKTQVKSILDGCARKKSTSWLRG